MAPLISPGDFSVSGLSEIPANWGVFPANASLSTEVSWVNANRLRVVRETAAGVVVDLRRALSPARDRLVGDAAQSAARRTL